MGLKGDEKMTPELQDKMGMALLYRRGLKEYEEGKIDEREFARRLSQEFAGLPKDESGKSFYHGDGLNAATVRYQDLLRAILEMKRDKSASLDTTTPELTGGAKETKKDRGKVSNPFA
jgi:hypothetical protein